MADDAVLSREEKKRRMMAWTAPWDEKSGLIAAVVRGKPLSAASSLSTLVPLAVGPTPTIDTDDADLDGLGSEQGERASGRSSILAPSARRKPRNPKPSEAESLRRSRLIKAFVAIVILCAGHCSFASRVEQASEEERVELVSLALEGKRSATLAARISPLTGYLSSKGQWPPTADSIYDFLKIWASPERAASRATRLLEAFRFMNVFGMRLDMIYDDPVLQGYSLRQSRRLGIRRQAAALSPETLALLEKVVATRALDQNCLLIAGAFLLAVALRARYSDLCSWKASSCIRSTINVEVYQTKNSGSITDRLGIFLVGPSQLLTSWPWYHTWMAERAAAGLTDLQPAFPARIDATTWSDQPARLQDVNRILKQVFLHIGATGSESVTSHAAKATLLHWAAVYGLSLETRSRLGYHANSAGGSTRSYSRDMLAQPLAELGEMLRRMRCDEWRLDDGTISATAPFVASEEAAIEDSDEIPDGQIDDLFSFGDSDIKSPAQMWGQAGDPSLSVDDEDSDSSSCKSTDSESDEAAEEAITKQAEIYLGLDSAVDCRRFINPAKDGKQHGGRPGSLTHTRCGLAIPGGSNISILVALASGESETSEASSLCKKCFRESKLS